jgi:hypothetical protein
LDGKAENGNRKLENEKGIVHLKRRERVMFIEDMSPKPSRGFRREEGRGFGDGRSRGRKSQSGEEVTEPNM